MNPLLCQYYLTGYVVELGLKACIARQTHAEEFPDKTRAERAWRHSPFDLVRAAGLERELNDRISSNAEFAALWAVAKDWQETSRYERHAEQEARDIFDAVSQEPNGVLAWIRRHW